jgi:hypothetical protein
MDHWTGAAWAIPSPIHGIASAGTQPLTLSGVWAGSPTNVWAVGLGGALVDFDGGSWSTESLMPELLSAWANTPDDAWAVGAGGTALHWNGTVWSTTNTGTTESLTAVWGASSGDVWALGSNTTLLQWNGSSWGPLTSPTMDPIVAIGGTSADDVWISNGANNLPDGPGQPGDGGTSAGPSNAGQLFHWNGSWTSALAPTAGWINAVWPVATGEAWAVGYQKVPNGIANSTGIVLYGNQSSLTLAETPLSSGSTVATDYTSVWGSGPNDVWVAGSAAGGSTAALIHFDGTTWTDMTAMLPNLAGTGALWGSSATDAWLWAYFAGSSQESLMHWNGSAWSMNLTLPDAWSYGNGITGTGPTDLWAVGSAGMILHHM